MRKVILILSIMVFLGGCATASKTYTSDGKEGYAINCSGSALNWGMCYEKAGNCVERKAMKFSKKAEIKVPWSQPDSMEFLAAPLSIEA